MSEAPNGAAFERTKDAVAMRLAETHLSADPGIERIYRIIANGLEDDPQEPIKLLQINPHTSTNGVLPVWFAADAPRGIFYPSIVVEIHPTEWDQLQRGQLSLPDGWSVDAAVPLLVGKA